MLSVIIRNDQEPNVIKLTYEQLFKELKNVPESELLVADDWLEGLSNAKSDFVCFVESDCLVNSGYFASQIGLLKKNRYMRKIAMQTTAVGVNNWANRVYGYEIGDKYIDGVKPIRNQKSREIYPVQIGFVPGAIIRKTMLTKVLEKLDINNTRDINLVKLSAIISFAFWRQGDGNRVHLNPNTTYVTTEDYVGDVLDYDPKPEGLEAMFKRLTI